MASPPTTSAGSAPGLCRTRERDDESKFEAFYLFGLISSVSDMSIVGPVLMVISPERATLQITVENEVLVIFGPDATGWRKCL